MGTGVVAFNLAPKRALLCDTNPHLIAFYHVGASENNRNPMIEAIITNYPTPAHEYREKQRSLRPARFAPAPRRRA